MPTLGEGAIGSLDYTSEERKILAKKSLSYTCTVCKIDNSTVLPVLTEKSQEISAEAKNLASQIEFKNKKQESTEQSINSTTDNTNPEQSIIQNELTRRVVLNEATTESSVSTPIITTSSSNVNRPNLNATTTIRQSDNGDSNLFLITVSILSAIFIFLFIRRVYLVVDTPFPI